MFSSNSSQVSGAANYIEDVFSTYLYTANGSTQTITNNINLSASGGLVWQKTRNSTASILGYHFLSDSARGSANVLSSNDSSAQNVPIGAIGGAFNTNGFDSIAYGPGIGDLVSWTFRKQPKFFDVVTYTGNGTDGRSIPHNLGSTPGSIIVKCTNIGVTNWFVWHRSIANNGLLLDSTSAASSTFWSPTDTPTSTNILVSGTYGTNVNGENYVAYLFAHNAGGFGLTGTDNVITCGAFSTDSGGKASVNLGYEPQWVMFKRTDSSTYGGWYMIDNMRGFTNPSGSSWLWANTANAEQTGINFSPESTGFSINFTGPANWIYIAIRRGPMKVPTDATTVFGLNARTGTGANATVTGGQTDDAVLIKNRGSAVASLFSSRLTGTGYLVTSTTAAEVAAGATILQASPWDVMDGVKVGTTSTITNASANTYINYLFRRAPSFFDIVTYTGDGSLARDISHSLTVTPEVIIVKRRDSTQNWLVNSGTTLANNINLFLNTQDANITASSFGIVVRFSTASTFQVAAATTYDANIANATYVAYLFATCAGVSKFGTYTGNGATQTINCGFTSGARFVLIKRTDSTGDWYIYDTARGMTVLTDPYLLLNTTAAEVATLGSVTTVATGFALNSAILAAINVNTGTYIFLAIA